MRTIKYLRELNNKQFRAILALFTRDQLRALVKSCDIPAGRTKDDTIHNLLIMRDQKNSLKNLFVRLDIM